MWVYRQERIKVSCHPVKFSDCSHSNSDDVLVLVCHVISQDHVIKGSCDFMERSSWSELTIPPSLLAIDALIVEIICHVIDSLSRDLARPHDQRVKRLYRLKPIKVSYHPVKFGSHWHCGSGSMMILVCDMISHDHVIKGLRDFMGRSFQGNLSSCQVW